MFCLTCLEVITAWLGVDSISGDHLIQLPCSKQVAHGPVQHAFEYLKGWRCHSLPGQPVPGLTDLTEKKKNKKSYVQMEFPVFPFVPINSYPFAGHH